MESPQSPDEPPDREGGAEPPPPPPRGPQAPSGPPGAPPAGPLAAPQYPGAPQAPVTPPPPPGPEGPLSYGGQVPPGGWEQPIAQHHGWTGQPLASWGSRVGATLIDGLILILPVVVLFFIVAGIATGSDVGAVVTLLLGFLAYLVVAFMYAPLLMARDGATNGQTWGKQMLGIRVVRDSGETMSFGWAAFREIVIKTLLFGWLGGVFAGIPWLLDVLWPLWDDQNRALHDMICSTHVVRT